jgi:hypothetical protein
MKKYGVLFLVLSSVLLLCAPGCNIFSSSGDSAGDLSQASHPTLLLKTDTSQKIEYENQEFFLSIPANAFANNEELQLSSALHVANPRLSEYFQPLSKKYTISFSQNPATLKELAKIGFINLSDVNPEQIFALCSHDSENWHLLSPQPQEASGRYTFLTSHFSQWYLARRIKKSSSTLISAPKLQTLPSVIYSDNKGLLSKDLIISSSFRIASQTVLNSQMYSQKLYLLAREPFSLSLAINEQQTKNYSSALDSNGLHRIALTERDALYYDASGNMSSATFQIKTKDQPAKNFPETLVVQTLITDPDSLFYEANLPINFSSETEPGTASTPLTLETIAPKDNAGNVNVHTPLYFQFNNPVASASLLPAFSIAPQTSIASLQIAWSTDFTGLTISPINGWQEKTNYVVTLGEELSDVHGNSLQQSLILKFSTGEAHPPEVESFYPPANHVLAVNGNLQFNFSEPVKENSFRIVIAPETAFKVEADSTSFVISPDTAWQKLTTYQVTLLSGLSDLYDNKTSENQTFEFTTGDVSAATIAGFSPANGFSQAPLNIGIQINFAQAMNQQKTLEAITMSSTLPDSSFSWNASFTILTVSFNQALNFSTDYEIVVSDTAETATGIRLANRYLYKFRTYERPAVVVDQLSPQPDATEIATNTVINIQFNRTMQPESVEQAFSLISENTEIINGSFSWNNKNLVFSPFESLMPGITYLLSIGKTAADTDGNQLAEAFTARFTTVTPAKTTITGTSPVDGTTNLSYDSPVILEFSQPINKDTFKFSITPPIEGSHNFTWENNDKKLKIDFSAGFSSNTRYTFEVLSETLDSFNKPVSSKSITFTSEVYSAPRLLSLKPQNGSKNIAANADIVLLFDQSMNTESVLNALTITPTPIGDLARNWDSDQKQLTISPSTPLDFLQSYSIIVNDQAKSLDGLSLLKTYESSFITASQTIIKNVSPASGSTDIIPQTAIEVSFSNTVNKTSAQNVFFAKSSEQKIAGQFFWENNTMSFKPDSLLPYQAVIIYGFSGIVTDASGLRVKTEQSYSFKVSNQTAPEVTSTLPSDQANDVTYNFSPQIKFSMPMNKSSVTLKIEPSVAAYNLQWNETADTLTLNGIIFSGDTNYKITVEAESESSSGITLRNDYSFSFKTAIVNGPEITNTYPVSGATAVKSNAEPVLYFNRSIDTESLKRALSISPSQAFSLTFTDNNKIAGLTFADRLKLNTVYRLTIGTKLQDSEGVALQEPFTVDFTTESAPAVTQMTPADNATQIEVDQVSAIKFDKAMNHESVENAITLLKGLDAVGISFSWAEDSKLVNIIPAKLLPGQTYSWRISTVAQDTNGNSLAVAVSSNFSTVAPPAFNMEFTQPATDLNFAPVAQTIVASFSNRVATNSLELTFLPAPPSGFNLSWANDNKTLTIAPNGQLTGEQQYEILINTNTKDIYAQSLDKSYSLTFTTVAIDSPEILSTEPVAGSLNVALNQSLRFNFSNIMNKTAVESSFTMTPAVAGGYEFLWSSDERSLEVVFANSLEDATSYQGRIDASATDIYGNQLGYNFLLSFQTLIRPELITEQLRPEDGAQGVPTASSIKMTFNKEMELASVQNAFTLKQGSNPITGSFAKSGKTIVFLPATTLEYSTLYQANLTSLPRDLAGNYVKTSYDWTFTTAAEQGKVWQLEQAQTDSSTHFSSRTEHVMIAFNDELYVIGGYDGTCHNDVWKSSDGSNFSKILDTDTTPGTDRFTPRAGHACAVFNNRIWLTGGYSETDIGTVYYDDVWSSANGINWTREIETADYYRRAFHNLVVYDNKLWIIAGETPDANNNLVLLDDCWNSSDGRSWQLKSQIVSFFGRKHCASEVIDGKLWVWGGYGGDGQAKELNDSWYTTNGDVWILDKNANSFLPRQGMAVLKFAEKVWLIGGKGAGSTYYNDIWVSADGTEWFEVLGNEAASTTHFSGRSFFKAAEISARMYISGGDRAGGFTNEVWSSQ